MKDRYILLFKLITFISAGAGGITASFLNLHLEQVVGLTGTEIGFVSFFSMLLVIIIKPIVGYIGDRTGQYAFVIKIALIASIIISIFYYQSRTFAMVITASLLFGLVRSPIMPFKDVIITNYCDKIKYDFGKIRVFTSLGWLLFSMLAGFLIAGIKIPWFGNQFIEFNGFLPIQVAIFGMSILASLITFILMFFVPKPDTTESDKKQKATKEDIKQLLTNKQFLFILTFIMTSLIVVEAAKTYMGNHLVMELGAAENIISWMMLVQVGPELILLPLGAKMLQKFGFKNWYIFSVSTMILRLAVYSFTTNLTVFVILSLVHGIAVCTHIAGNIAYIRKVVAPNMLGLAFTIVASVTATTSAILGLLFGYVYEHMNGFIVFRIATVILIGTLILVICSKSLDEVGSSITNKLLLKENLRG